MLMIYDSLSQTKRPFTPLIPNKVRMYVCGVTVYDECHLGHARTYLAFDVIRRYLSYKGYQVELVRNITDIDDKIIQRANQLQIPYQEHVEKYVDLMYQDFKLLNILPPSQEPRATTSMSQIINFIQTLISKGYAYVGANQDVFFEIAKFQDYGKLAHQDLSSLLSGARIDENPFKKNPLDFVLWKAAKANEPAWDSPWGAGRPGWHIECSAMAHDCLGATLDIHGGGFDLQFPHHENERAQSECFSGQQFVNYWMHVGFLNVKEEKMSKSLHNFITISEALKNYSPESLRYFFITSHYRSMVNYSDANLEHAAASLNRLYTALRDLDIPLELAQPNPILNTYRERFIQAMDDDFNTPLAMSVLFDLAKQINSQKNLNPNLAAELGYLLKELGSILGLFTQAVSEYFQNIPQGSGLSSEQIEFYIQARNDARANKNWQEADRLRKLLLDQAIVLEDSKDGTTTWRREG